MIAATPSAALARHGRNGHEGEGATMSADDAPRSVIGQIRDAFGWDGFPHALVYETEAALRFDLGRGLPFGPARFLGAVDRARAVAAVLFDGAATLTAVAAYYDGERRTSRAARSFAALAAMGFDAPFGRPERVLQNDADHRAAFGEDLCRWWHAADFAADADRIAVLLWAAVAREMPVTPKARWLTDLYLVDFCRATALHVYDDRGMDVVAADVERLRPLHGRFGDWLLAHDRPRADATFGRPA